MVGATVALVAAASCNQVAGIDPADEGCRTVADCRVGEPACRTAVACQEHVCVFEDAVEGKPLPEQTAGDCVQLVCDGAGSAKQVPLPADVPDDRDICTIDACDGTAPVHTLSESVPCYTGPAGTAGVGLCHAGLQRCDEQGKPVGTCDGEVTPQAEVCDSGGDDEDCDGETNENGEDCACGDGWVSAGVGEECDDGGTIDGDGCAASCVRERVVRIEAGQYHTCAILNTGRIKCWGLNSSGQLGIGDTVNRGDVHGQMGSALPVTDLGTDARVESLAMGGSHTCARLTSGAVKCWGGSGVGALGLGAITSRGAGPNQMGDRLEVVKLGGVAAAIAAGGGHTCALVSGDVTRCWGWNAFGQLGLGDGENRSEANGLPVSLGGGKVAFSFALGERHTCARMNGGSVKCWGYNVDGQLGIGDTVGRGDDPDEMGNSLRTVDLGGEPTLAISAGLYHTCARMSGGSVKCWGHNAHGQLGMGDTIYRGTATSQMGDNLSEVEVGEAVTALAAGGVHTCALLASRRVKCWGDNDFGQLGLGHIDRRGDEPDEMGDALAPVDLGEGATAEAITAGVYHTCALLSDGRVKCWGRNHLGQLGLGDMEPRGDAPDEMGDALPAVELFKRP